jgi:hypothetical protein
MTHVGEWTKKVDCWNRVAQLNWELPETVSTELISAAAAKTVAVQTVEAGLSDGERATITTAAAIPAEDWFGISSWAKQTDNLRPWQRQIAFSLGKLANQGREPSIKQAVQGMRLLDEAARLGFKRS